MTFVTTEIYADADEVTEAVNRLVEQTVTIAVCIGEGITATVRGTLTSGSAYTDEGTEIDLGMFYVVDREGGTSGVATLAVEAFSLAELRQDIGGASDGHEYLYLELPGESIVTIHRAEDVDRAADVED